MKHSIRAAVLTAVGSTGFCAASFAQQQQ